jgi:hypothetical protein
MILAARPAAPQFTSFTHNSCGILEGNWQSCREAAGRYSERVYDHLVSGVGKFELNMGPRREFALFKGGGSPMECESWFILLEPLEKTSH